MERGVLKLGGRSCGDGMEGAAWKERHGRSGMEGAVWKVLEGMVDMDGMEGMDGMDRIPCKDTTFL